MFFLDFDRTLFDSDCLFEEVLLGHEVLQEEARLAWEQPSGSKERQEFYRFAGTHVEQGNFSVDPGAFAKYVYPDALQFLKTYGEQVVIITYSDDVTFQKHKVEATGLHTLVSGVLYTKDPKGPVLRKEFPEKPTGFFVDDSPAQLASVSHECPWLTPVEMRRDEKESTGHYKTVKNFEEFEKLL